METPRDVSHADRRLVADDPTVAPEWPRFVVGQLYLVNNYWFKASAIRPDGTLVLAPEGPSKGLLRKIKVNAARRAQRFTKEMRRLQALQDRARRRRKQLEAKRARRRAAAARHREAAASPPA